MLIMSLEVQRRQIHAAAQRLPPSYIPCRFKQDTSILILALLQKTAAAEID